MASQSAGRKNYRHSVVVKFLCKVVDELRSLVDIFHVKALVESLCHCLHRAHIDTSVSEESLVERYVLHHHLSVLGILACDDTSLGKSELAGREVDDVEVVGKAMVDGLDVHILATCLTCLHEVHVVLKERCVEHADNVVVMADVGHCKHVLERNWLSTDKVCTSLNTNECHVFSTLLLDSGTELSQVEVALKWVVSLRTESLLRNEFLNCSTHASDVSLSRCEVEVHERHLSWFYEC